MEKHIVAPEHRPVDKHALAREHQLVDLNAKSEAEALEIVKSTSDIERLKAFKARDQRMSVKTAVDERLLAIDHAASDLAHAEANKAPAA